MSARRTELLERLNTLDAGPTEDDRKAEREASVGKVAQTAEALAREGRLAAGIWGFFGRAGFVPKIPLSGHFCSGRDSEPKMALHQHSLLLANT